eukprot:236235-Amorphochlora_amoeboformis.AAC.1
MDTEVVRVIEMSDSHLRDDNADDNAEDERKRDIKGGIYADTRMFVCAVYPACRGIRVRP